MEKHNYIPIKKTYIAEAIKWFEKMPDRYYADIDQVMVDWKGTVPYWDSLDKADKKRTVSEINGLIYVANLMIDWINWCKNVEEQK